jgi:uncharacterized protein with GYD domain
MLFLGMMAIGSLMGYLGSSNEILDRLDHRLPRALSLHFGSFLLLAAASSPWPRYEQVLVHDDGLYLLPRGNPPERLEDTMKYVLLGTLNAEWVQRHAERTTDAKAKLQALGITLDAVYYTQGSYDFVDVIDAPSGEAALTFSVWYASRGYGRIQTLSAFDANVMEEAAQGERKGKKREARSAKAR